jgi:hypothetical protein
VSLKGKPRLDKEGRVLETSLVCRSASGLQIGEVFSEAKGANPSHTLRGDELDVRSIVTSSAAPEVPSSEFTLKRAWTQPVGWRAWPMHGPLPPAEGMKHTFAWLSVPKPEAGRGPAWPLLRRCARGAVGKPDHANG